MKTNNKHQSNEDFTSVKPISVERAREIMNEEEIEYTDLELQEILEFISKVLSITTLHYERIRQDETKVISINTSKHETKSIPLHPSKHRRAS
jgi:hypothetical protein